jgi:hypothetical protein
MKVYCMLSIIIWPGGLAEGEGSVQEPYSQHFVFFVTYEWTWQARVLQKTTLERLAREKHSSLLEPFVSYEKKFVNTVLDVLT